MQWKIEAIEELAKELEKYGMGYHIAKRIIMLGYRKPIETADKFPSQCEDTKCGCNYESKYFEETAKAQLTVADVCDMPKKKPYKMNMRNINSENEGYSKAIEEISKLPVDMNKFATKKANLPSVQEIDHVLACSRGEVGWISGREAILAREQRMKDAKAIHDLLNENNEGK